MTYIKLLTVLAGLVIMTACGGGTAKTPDKAGGGGNTTNCTTNPFAADCSADATATTLRETMCLADSTADPSCDGEMGIATVFCEANPFDTATACGHEDYDDDRETACQTHGTGMGGDDSCATSLASSCTITDPFAYTGCNNVEEIAGVRTMYCEDSATAWDEECMDDTHGTVVFYRTVACLDSPFNDLADPLCATDTGAEFQCGMNPFDIANPGCRNLMKFSEIVGNYCTTNDAADCPNVTTADWVASFSAAPLATAPVNRGGSIEVGFLSGLTKTQPTIAGFTSSSSSYASLTLADHNLGGDTNDGFAIWFGSWNGNVNNYYSGILPTTDVGAPLNNAKQGGTWNGRILAFNSVDGVTNKDVTFTVNFGDKEINAFFASSVGSAFYEIEGSFEGGVVLTGSVDYGLDNAGGSANGKLESGDGLYVNGTLTGLIGSDGAVGAFIGKRDDVSFSGGFVAVPRVATHANFKTYYAARTDNRRLHATTAVSTDFASFVEGTATSLPTDGLTFTGGTGRFAPFTVRLGEAVSGDNGFAIMYGVTAVGNNNRYRAGLLSGTDLGPALDNTISTAWTGTIYTSLNLASGVPASIPLDLTVDFTAGTIESDAVTVATGLTADINGLFRAGSNNNDLPVGILGGTVMYLGVSVPLIGLIGTEGVLGIFHGDGLTIAGGFQASPN